MGLRSDGANGHAGQPTADDAERDSWTERSAAMGDIETSISPDDLAHDIGTDRSAEERPGASADDPPADQPDDPPADPPADPEPHGDDPDRMIAPSGAPSDAEMELDEPGR